MRISFILFFISIACIGSAQVNAHYWSHQYGAQGLLLNGSVIASVNDETAIFYNPGGMVMDDDVGISLSLITPSLSIVRNSDFLGEGTSFVDRGVDLAPGLVAAVFKPFGTNKVTLGLTTFKRFQTKINFDDRVVDIVQNNNSQVFVGDLEFDREINETWVGLALGVKLHERLGVGLSQFITFRGEEVRLKFKKEIVDRDNPADLIAGWRSDFGYGFSANGGSLTKFGMCWSPFGLKLGITYTTHTYGLAVKDAEYAFDDQKVRTNGTSTVTSNDRDIDLQEYYTPWSFGAGIQIPLKSVILSISAEYFDAIDKYTLFSDLDDPLDGLGAEEPTFVSVSQQSDRVLNIALGIARPLSPKYTLYYGMRTDFSPNNVLDLGDGISFLATSPDIIHISGGLAYAYRKSQFSVGLDYGFGYKSGGRQLTDISNLTTDNIFQFSGEGDVETYIHQFTMYITYDF